MPSARPVRPRRSTASAARQEAYISNEGSLALGHTRSASTAHRGGFLKDSDEPEPTRHHTGPAGPVNRCCHNGLA